MWSSLRYAVRLMRQSPGFTLVAVATLALGIGANTAIFSVVNALLLRPLPLEDPSRLVFLSGTNPRQPGNGIPFSVPAYESVRDGNTVFTGLSAFTSEGMTLTGAGDPVQLSIARVSPNFFEVLRTQPIAGRAFQAAEGEAGGAPVALISQGLWERRFASDPALVGKSITLAQAPYTVIGIAPRGFAFPRENMDAWITRVMGYTGLSQDQIRNGAGFLTGIARLKPGVTVTAADAEVAALNRHYREEHPRSPDADPNGRMFAAPLQETLVSDIRPALLLLAGAVGLVLLIACANVASLMLARATGRAKEIAVRAALGASRWDIVRQLLAESLALAAAGAVCGIGLAQWGVSLLAGANVPALPGYRPLQVDLPVLAFCLGVSLLTGVAFGLMPALQASRPDLNTVLRDSGWGTIGGAGRHRTRSLLVTGQIALSVVLLIAAGLLIESFRSLEGVNPGFDPHNGLTMRISMPPARYPDDARRTRFVHDTLDRIEALPGVRSATASLGIPMSVWVMAPFLAEGQAPAPLAQRPLAEWRAITPGFFQTLGIPLLRGRAFTWRDDETAPPRVIVSQALARRFFGDADPLGRHITYARREVAAEIIGVAGDVKSRGLESEAGLVLYTSYPQFAWANLALTIRTTADPARMVNAVRAQVFAGDRDLPVTNVETLAEYVEGALTQRRQMIYLIAGFAAVALLLAVVGLYGVMAYSVAQRSTEIGIRQAIGAQPSDIRRMVLWQGLRLSVTGIGIGTVAATAATRLLSGMLFHVSATDPLTFAGISLLFLVVALAASWIPAHRATRVDPLEALRR
ncbi:MAG TPA: ABC transporter permease [Acetobacteraceae bacterium]